MVPQPRRRGMGVAERRWSLQPVRRADRLVAMDKPLGGAPGSTCVRHPLGCLFAHARSNPNRRQNATASGQRSSVSIETWPAASPRAWSIAAATSARPTPDRRHSGLTSNQGIDTRDGASLPTDSAARITPAGHGSCHGGRSAAGGSASESPGRRTDPSQTCTFRPGRLTHSASIPAGRTPHASATTATAVIAASPTKKGVTTTPPTARPCRSANPGSEPRTSITIRTTAMTEL